MQIIHYALASLRYHRRIYGPFLLVMSVITLLLFFTLLLRNTLIDFSQQILSLVRSDSLWGSNTALQQQITDSSKEVGAVYQWSCWILSSLIVIGVFLFNFLYFRKRSAEYRTLRNSGLGIPKVLGQLTAESLIPLLLFSFVAFCLILTCQTLFQHLFQHLHILLIDHLDQNVDHLLIKNTDVNQTWMVKMPNRLSTLLQTILLDSKGWFQLVSKSLLELWGLLLVTILGSTGVALLVNTKRGGI